MPVGAHHHQLQLAALLLRQNTAPLIQLPQCLQQVFLGTQPDLAAEISMRGLFRMAAQHMQEGQRCGQGGEWWGSMSKRQVGPVFVVQTVAVYQGGTGFVQAQHFYLGSFAAELEHHFV